MKYRTCWQALDRAERPLLDWVVCVRRGGAIEQVTKIVSLSGEHGFAWYALAALAATRDEKNSERWIVAAFKVMLVYALNTVIKLVARRRRPTIGSLAAPTELSFPSSHAATSFAAAEIYGQIVPPARPLLLAAAAGMTATRLHFCLHYPSDLIAGAALGTAAARALR